MDNQKCYRIQYRIVCQNGEAETNIMDVLSHNERSALAQCFAKLRDKHPGAHCQGIVLEQLKEVFKVQLVKE
jgi:hypothetical protein